MASFFFAFLFFCSTNQISANKSDRLYDLKYYNPSETPSAFKKQTQSNGFKFFFIFIIILAIVIVVINKFVLTESPKVAEPTPNLAPKAKKVWQICNCCEALKKNGCKTRDCLNELDPNLDSANCCCERVVEQLETNFEEKLKNFECPDFLSFFYNLFNQGQSENVEIFKINFINQVIKNFAENIKVETLTQVDELINSIENFFLNLGIKIEIKAKFFQTLNKGAYVQGREIKPLFHSCSENKNLITVYKDSQKNYKSFSIKKKEDENLYRNFHSALFSLNISFFITYEVKQTQQTLNENQFNEYFLEHLSEMLFLMQILKSELTFENLFIGKSDKQLTLFKELFEIQGEIDAVKASCLKKKINTIGDPEFNLPKNDCLQNSHFVITI